MGSSTPGHWSDSLLEVTILPLGYRVDSGIILFCGDSACADGTLDVLIRLKECSDM